MSGSGWSACGTRTRSTAWRSSSTTRRATGRPASRSRGTSSTTRSRSKTAFAQGEADDRWRPFWALRYNLSCGRRVEPLRRLPVWDAPRLLLVVDPTVHRELDEEQRQRLDEFLRARGLSTVGSLDELEEELEEGRPQLMYWLGHATPEYLLLGDDQIEPLDLLNLLQGMTTRSVRWGRWRSSTPARRPRRTARARSSRRCTAAASAG